MKRYRVKNSAGRTLGPFHLEELKELAKNKKISKIDLYQLFPIGEWSKYNEIFVRDEIFVEEKKTQSLKKKKVIEKPLPQTEDTDFIEFQFDKKVEKIPKKKAAKKIEKEEPVPDDEDKTVIRKMPSVKDVDNTVILSKGADVSYDSDDDSSDAAEDIPSLDEKTNVAVNEVLENIEEVDSSDETRIDVKPLVVKRKKEDEKEIENKLRSLEVELRKKEKRKQAKRKEIEDVEEDVEEQAVKKKQRLFVLLILFAAVIFLMPEDKKQIDKVIRPVLKFPVTAQYVNKDKAQALLEKGIESYSKYDYISKVKAASYFYQSLQQKFKDNPAISYLILSYSELLPESRNKNEAGKVLNKLVTINRSKQLTDFRVVLGAANFYSFFNKKRTAVMILENYLRLNPPTPVLYARYLELLIDIGELVKAEKAFEKLKSAPKNKISVIRALTKYYEINEEPKKAIELLKDTYKEFSENLEYLVLYSNFLMKQGDLVKVESLSKLIVKNKGGGSPYIFSQGLKYLGYIYASRGELEKAGQFFNLSLKNYEDEDLRSDLASLDIAGTDLTKKIITSSKVDLLLSKASSQVKLGNWKKAFSLALDATEISPESKKAQLYLASIQSKRGFFESAITTLERLRGIYPKDKKINYELVIAHLRAFKVTEVKRLIATLSTFVEFKGSYEYHSMLGQYYAYIGNEKFAFKSFKAALVKNPLADEIYYKMAEIAFRIGRFKRSKEFLNDAIKFDPANFDYKVLYSKVLYELDGVDTAIGYLRNELKNSVDNPKLLGQIAVFYYRDQNYKEYNRYREELERMNVRDESIYEYLIEVALLEGSDNLVIENAEKLLILNPGNLKVRMELARVYQKKNRLQDALNQLREIEERLAVYPNVNYQKAVIYLKNNEMDKALASAELEIKNDPSSEYGFYIKGEILMRQEKYGEAKKALERSISLKPDFYECLMALGGLKFKQSLFAQARELYNRALRQRENEPEVHKRLGYVYKETGQGQIAIERFKTYLNLSPAAADRNKIEQIIRELQ